MQDLNDKITGNDLTADEWNEMPSELQNVITQMGIALSGADLNQLGKALTLYNMSSDFYVATGLVGAYSLATTGGSQAAVGLIDGMRVRFYPNQGNIGEPTINLAGLGAKTLKLSNGDAVPNAYLNPFEIVECIYRSSSDTFTMSAFTIGSRQQSIGASWRFISGLDMSNGTSLRAFEVGGTERDLVRLSTSDRVEIGNSSNPLTLVSPDGVLRMADRAGVINQRISGLIPRAIAMVNVSGSLVASYGVATISNPSAGEYALTLLGDGLGTALNRIVSTSLWSLSTTYSGYNVQSSAQLLGATVANVETYNRSNVLTNCPFIAIVYDTDI